MNPPRVAVEKIAVWLPGHGVVPFLPPGLDLTAMSGSMWQTVVGCHHGWGVEFQRLPGASPERWFQVPFPMMTDPSWHIRLDDFALFFRSDETCQVLQVDFWDGPDKFDSNQLVDPPLSGDLRHADATANRWQPRRAGGEKLPIRNALNVSIKVTYGKTDDSIVFCAAHATFDKM